jgi:hypothetical protein
MEKRVSLQQSQTRLLITWGAFAVAMVIVVAIKVHNDMYVRSSPDGELIDGSDDVWKGLLQMIVPTLTLMVGTVAGEALQMETDATVSGRAYRLSLTLSVLYLLSLLVVVLLSGTKSPTPTLVTSNQLLLAFQGLVSLSLGSFFVSRRGATDAKKAGADGDKAQAPPSAI